jgi:hypothetical protein
VSNKPDLSKLSKAASKAFANPHVEPVCQTLMGVPEDLHFVIGDIAVSATHIRKVAQKLKAGPAGDGILLSIKPEFKGAGGYNTTGSYTFGSNTLTLPARYAEMPALVVHEAVHAVHDLNRDRAVRFVGEAAAYVAQAMYTKLALKKDLTGTAFHREAAKVASYLLGFRDRSKRDLSGRAGHELLAPLYGAIQRSELYGDKDMCMALHGSGVG